MSLRDLSLVQARKLVFIAHSKGSMKWLGDQLEHTMFLKVC
jgi:hypothetical protein